MAKVAIVFEPLADEFLDEERKRPARLGEFIDTERTDCIIIYRLIGEQFEGGSSTEIISSGIWENVSLETFMEAVDRLGELEGSDGEEAHS